MSRATVPRLNLERQPNLIRFSSGRQLLLYNGEVGLDHDLTVGRGFCSYVPVPWTRKKWGPWRSLEASDSNDKPYDSQDARELADIMISRWTEYKERLPKKRSEKVNKHSTPAAESPVKWYTRLEVCDMLGISLSTLQRHMRDGTGPIYSRLAKRRIGYRFSDLEDWVRLRTATMEVRPYPERSKETAQ